MPSHKCPKSYHRTVSPLCTKSASTGRMIRPHDDKMLYVQRTHSDDKDGSIDLI